MNSLVPIILSILLYFGTICESLPQFLPVAVQLGTEPSVVRSTTTNKSPKTRNSNEVEFVPPSDPNYNKTHEEDLKILIKDEASNLLIPPSDEENQLKLTDLLLPEEIAKIENTSKPLQDFIAGLLSGFVKNHKNVDHFSTTHSTTLGSEHIMKIPSDNNKDGITQFSTTSTTTEKPLVTISLIKPQKNRKRKIKSSPNNLLHENNLIWHLRTINEKPAQEVLATDKALLARDLKDDTTESAVIKVKKLKISY